MQNLVRALMCYQCMGQFNKTVGFLDQALSLHADETCWFQRKIATSYGAIWMPPCSPSTTMRLWTLA